MSNSTYLTLLLGLGSILLVSLVGWYSAEQRHRRRNRDLITELRAQQIAAASNQTQLLDLEAQHDEAIRQLYRARSDAADADARAEHAREQLERLRSDTRTP